MSNEVLIREAEQVDTSKGPRAAVSAPLGNEAIRCATRNIKNLTPLKEDEVYESD